MSNLMNNVTLGDLILPDMVVVDYLSQAITDAIDQFYQYQTMEPDYCILSIRSYIEMSIEMIEFRYPEIQLFRYNVAYNPKSNMYAITLRNTYSVKVGILISRGMRWYIKK